MEHLKLTGGFFVMAGSIRLKRAAKNDGQYFVMLDFAHELRSWVITFDPPSTCSDPSMFTGFHARSLALPRAGSALRLRYPPVSRL
jgi:hypothetical protein